jgi:hypothetical protein
MESEYIALSQSMRDLIPIREILKDIKKYMFLDENYTPKCASHSKAFKDAEIPESKGLPQFSVYEDSLPQVRPDVQALAANKAHVYSFPLV